MYILSMKYLSLLLFVCLSFFSQSLAADSLETKSEKSAVWIPLEGEVSPEMNDFVRRAIGEAQKQKPDYIIFEVNTFGGRLDAAFDIVDTILAVKNAETVTLVKSKAISAGALISLASKTLYMMDGTTIGDCAPIVQNNDGTPQIIGEKIQSPLRAKFRNLAQKNGYPEELSSAMVTPELEILQFAHGDSTLTIEGKKFEKFSDSAKAFWGSPRVLVREGELLTLTEAEAVQHGFSKKTVTSRADVERELAIVRSTTVEQTDGEKFAAFIAGISGLLLIIGFGALYMEFKTPGFGVFGVVGIVAIGLVFFGSQAGRIDNFLPLVFLVLGVILFAMEILVIPGTMICGVAGIISLIVALALAFDFTALPAFLPEFSNDFSPLLVAILYVLACAAVALVIPLVFSKYIVPLLPEGYTPMLKTDLADSQSPTENVSTINVGMQGVAKTFLRPVGHAEFDGFEIDVQTTADDIEPGDAIEVTKVQDGRVFVKKI